ncbi:MAG: acyl carrier protein [Thermotogaceae bacterium]|nr:acyl carrier protein [Thermotogaceae bacterium]
MERKEIFEKVVNVLSDKLGVEGSSIAESSSLTDDLGADSLDLVDLVMELEEQFGVKIDDSELEKLSTVKDVVDYIEKSLS